MAEEHGRSEAGVAIRDVIITNMSAQTKLAPRMIRGIIKSMSETHRRWQIPILLKRIDYGAKPYTA